jgi:hypothetical protein
MIDSPEFIKAMYGFVSTAILGIAGVGYKKIKQIDYQLDERPTLHETKDLINKEVTIVNIKQDHIIETLKDIKASVDRLEDNIIRK